VAPSEKGGIVRGLLCRCSLSGPISTNSLAPTPWKNLRPNDKDTFNRGPSYRGSGDNPPPAPKPANPSASAAQPSAGTGAGASVPEVEHTA
jgi:hypothetical protein